MISNELLLLERMNKVTIPSKDNFPFLYSVPTKYKEFENWIVANISNIKCAIIKHGAVLFRGCQVLDSIQLENIIKFMGIDLDDGYGDLPKSGLESNYIFQSTPYPNTLAILFHNEASHTPLWPHYQWFYCANISAQGGETPLLNCSKLLKMIPKRIKNKFLNSELLYIRNFIKGLDVSWKNYFNVNTKYQLEKKCKINNISCNWLTDDILRTTTSLPGIIQHPETKQMIFFNQILLHHLACTDSATRTALIDLFGMENLPRNVMFSDNTQIDDNIIETLLKLSCSCAICFDWEEGDLLMVDNLQIAHARRPYLGNRKIFVSLSKLTPYRSLLNI